MRWLVFVMLAFGCGTKKEAEAKAPPEPVEDKDKDKDKDKDSDEGGGLRGRLGGIADRAKDTAKDLGTEVTDRAKDKAKELGSDAEQLAVTKAKSLAEKAGDLSAEAITSGNLLKGDLLGKLDFIKSHFDVTIDSTPEAEADYRARISGMKQIKVGDYTVGIAQDSKHPLGTVYKWQFRITWRVPLTGRAIRLSFYSNEELKDLENAATLLTIITAADRLSK